MCVPIHTEGLLPGGGLPACLPASHRSSLCGTDAQTTDAARTAVGVQVLHYIEECRTGQDSAATATDEPLTGQSRPLTPTTRYGIGSEVNLTDEYINIIHVHTSHR